MKLRDAALPKSKLCPFAPTGPCGTRPLQVESLLLGSPVPAKKH